MPSPILSLLGIVPSPESVDYVSDKKPFQLHTLLTEQRHPRTMDLSGVIKVNISSGLRQIFSVDRDISMKFRSLSQDTTRLTQAAHAVSRAIRDKRQIYIYGCGATGRLSKQMESNIWRPFWTRVKNHSFWNSLKSILADNIENLLIGEMTGGDRALISSLEGFEDLQLMGQLQLQDREIEKGDVVFCITEGGETSSVIGTILAAADRYDSSSKSSMAEAQNHLYFIYNNPDAVLLPFERSRKVLQHPGITKIELATGPQAITGSTRMQATTAETYIMGLILETGIHGFLKDILSRKELKQLGFSEEPKISKKLLEFGNIENLVQSSIQDIADFTALESKTYESRRQVIYFAKKAMIPVFIDCTERSPTFHLLPLDTIHEKKKKCWLHVWTEAEDSQQAWTSFLGRKFRGLDKSFYKDSFEQKIQDPYLQEAALSSLEQAGSDQEQLYDFSFSQDNIRRRELREGDLGVLVVMDEEIDELSDPHSHMRQFIRLFREKNGRVALVIVGETPRKKLGRSLRPLALNTQKDVILSFQISRDEDPLSLRREILFKILLNGHSTGVMARLGRVVGNTMTNVKPGNLKLIGRATHLIHSHVNDHVPITYAEANAVLFEAIHFLRGLDGQISEVELSIIRILEACKQNKNVVWDQALKIAESDGLENYLNHYNPGPHP